MQLSINPLLLYAVYVAIEILTLGLWQAASGFVLLYRIQTSGAVTIIIL
jgi:hypothetical protein